MVQGPMSSSIGGSARRSKGTQVRRPLLWTALLLAALAVAAPVHILELRQAGLAKTTVTRMRQLHGVLQAADQQDLSEGGIRSSLVEYGRLECAADAWGHAFKVERVSSEPLRFRITSLGRDGVKGSCCRAVVGENWDEDAVMEGDKWLQIWRY